MKTAAALTSQTGTRHKDASDQTYVAGPDVARSLNSQRDGYNDGSDQTYVVPALTSKMAKGTGGPSGDECQNLVTGFHMTQDPVSVEDGVPAWGKGNAQGTASIAVSIRTSNTGANGHGVADDAAHTLDSAQGQAVVGAGVRRLTPTECERLQGLPDGWTLPGADSRRYAGLGDAVTANVAHWIGERLNRFGGE